MNHSSSSSSSPASITAMQLVTTASIVPRALKTAVELNLLELMKKAAAPVLAAELTAQIQTSNPEAHLMIDRILRLLAATDILQCTLRNRPHGGGAERVYSLAPVSMMFVNNDNGVSLAPLLILQEDKVFAEPFYHLKEAIIEGGRPFERVHGVSAYEHQAIDPRFNKLFNDAMYGISSMCMHEILEKYNGFEGVKTLVDVGGGTGSTLKMILSKYPSIKAINFDLPHVIQHAPSHPGLNHVGGDMFVSVPKGDAIFMKWNFPAWSDEQLLKVLKKCKEAVAKNGKVIMAERIIPEIPNKDPAESIDFATDVLMLACYTGGKERTEAEFQALAKAAGFKQFHKLCCSFNTWIMELYD